MEITYQKTYRVDAVLEVRTGLHVGAGKDGVDIGGIDSPVVKHPHTLRPYIPGSSIKGRLRSLLEWALHNVEPNGDVWGSDNSRVYPPGDPILRAFGVSSGRWSEGPTRLIVRDAQLDDEWARGITARGLPLTEAKQEVTINRLEGKAAGMGPRTMERIPAGAKFHVEILFKRYSLNGDGGSGDVASFNRVLEAMRLLEQDALGGSGSRGYGRVEFTRISVDDEDITARFRNIGSIDPVKPQAVIPV